ncbi:hypothetical protein VTO42DRAFT_2118 [Malbranchea cinnamomea]
MTNQDHQVEASAASQSYDAPGAYPATPGFPDDAQVSSDLTSLSRAVKARRAEYTRQKKIRVRIGSWNVAALPGTEEDLGEWFVQPISGLGVPNNRAADGLSERSPDNSEAGTNREDCSKGCSQQAEQSSGTAVGEDHIDIYVLGLQEIVDVSSPSEAFRPYVDPAPSTRWKDAVQKVLPPGYELISSQQLMGLLLLIYAAPSIAPSISSVSSCSVGTGLMGYMGNKGAVATRIVIGGTTRVVFLNCHLAAGADKTSFDRRNWDAGQIVARTKFDPLEEEDDISEEPSLVLGQEDFAFWFGDLNYRLDGIPGGDVRRLLHLHTENRFRLPLQPREEDTGNAQLSSPYDDDNDQSSTDPEHSLDRNITLEDNDIESFLDPTSLQTTLSSLLPHDQLVTLQKKQKAFHEGWREGPIKFLPTYKYDVGRVGVFDSSDKQRSPSWCDRILYRTKLDYTEYLKRTKEAEEAKKRDEEMRNLGLEQAAEDDNVLFDYDPESDGIQDIGDYDENEDFAEAADAASLAGHETASVSDAIQLLSYTSHQNIVSSDHKPLHADFTLAYNAVIPELKAKVHQEVVRDLDRAENEARPDITVVVDRPFRKSNDETAAHSGLGDPDTVDFGQVRYDVTVSRGLTLANTGSVPATFSFCYRPNDDGNEADSQTPSWLDVRVDWPPDNDDPGSNTPKEYTLSPGESVQAQLSMRINNIDFVRELNRGKANLEDILVLRVVNGRDLFISVRGRWLPTCFGLSLSELTRLPEGGVRQVSDAKSQILEVASRDDIKSVARMSAPRELFRLTEAIAELTERSVAEWDMVSQDSAAESCPWMSEHAGWPFNPDTWAYPDSNDRQKLLSDTREAIDTGGSFSSLLPPELPARYRVELLAETLLSFLQSLDDGLITQSIWNTLEQQILTNEKLKRTLTADQSQSLVLEILSSSPAHSVSFTFLTFMLNRVANEIAPVLPSALSPPTSPSAPRRSTSLSISSLPRSESGTTSSSPTPSTISVPAPSLSFPFRFKSRSRGFSSGVSTDNDITNTTTSPQSPACRRRQEVNRSFAKIFADVIFSSRIVPPGKEKDRRAWEERKIKVLEPFLNLDGR